MEIDPPVLVPSYPITAEGLAWLVQDVLVALAAGLGLAVGVCLAIWGAFVLVRKGVRWVRGSVLVCVLMLPHWAYGQVIDAGPWGDLVVGGSALVEVSRTVGGEAFKGRQFPASLGDIPGVQGVSIWLASDTKIENWELVKTSVGCFHSVPPNYLPTDYWVDNQVGFVCEEEWDPDGSMGDYQFIYWYEFKNGEEAWGQYLANPGGTGYALGWYGCVAVEGDSAVEFDGGVPWSEAGTRCFAVYENYPALGQTLVVEVGEGEGQGLGRPLDYEINEDYVGEDVESFEQMMGDQGEELYEMLEGIQGAVGTPGGVYPSTAYSIALPGGGEYVLPFDVADLGSTFRYQASVSGNSWFMMWGDVVDAFQYCVRCSMLMILYLGFFQRVIHLFVEG